MNITWREVTRNCHMGILDGVSVVSVERPQKNRADGTKHDWSIVVLGDRYTWNKIFCHHDPRDLESTKRTAEQRLKWAIDHLHRAVHARGSKKTARSGS